MRNNMQETRELRNYDHKETAFILQNHWCTKPQVGKMCYNGEMFATAESEPHYNV